MYIRPGTLKGWTSSTPVFPTAHIAMGPFPSPEPITDPEKLLEAFEELMPFRVRDILLVSEPLSIPFILREDGRLNELLIGDSLELHLSTFRESTHVSSGPEAIALARSDARFTSSSPSDGGRDGPRRAGTAGQGKPASMCRSSCWPTDYRQIKGFRSPVIR